jgi:hypothetical protein
MPYIPQCDRKKFYDVLDQLPEIKTKGELEYVLFYLIKKNYMKIKSWTYNELHSAVYACSHVADEFRRRYLDKRENEAIECNGDI